MQLILDIPMLTNHGDKGGGGPYQTGQVEAVVTRDGGVLVRRPNRFHGNNRLEARPLLERRQGLQVRHRPDASAHAPSVGGVECIKEIVLIAPRNIMLDMLMKMRLDCCVGLLVVVLKCQEVVAVLVQDLLSNGRLTAHRINSDDAAFDSEQLEQFWYGRDRIGLLRSFDLAYDEAPMIRTPGRDHVQGGRGGSPIKRGPHRQGDRILNSLQ